MKRITGLINYIPILWLIPFAVAIVYATIKLGHLPQYGKDPDPTEMGLEAVNFIGILCLIGALVIWLLGPFLYLTYFILKQPYNKTAIYVYLLGLLLLFVLRPTGIFDWYTD